MPITSTINDDNFDEILNQNKLVLVDFWAKWCGPCKMFTPIIDQISHEYTDAKITKCDVDESPNSAIKYSINSIPTILIFKEGKQVGKYIGPKTKNFLIEELNKHK